MFEDTARNMTESKTDRADARLDIDIACRYRGLSRFLQRLAKPTNHCLIHSLGSVEPSQRPKCPHRARGSVVKVF